MIKVDDYIVSIDNFPVDGVLFRDITPLCECGEAFYKASYMMKELADKYQFNKIICAESRGFIFGSAMSMLYSVRNVAKGIVLARKPGKLPRVGESETYNLEYGTATLEIAAGSILPGDRVLVVDDLLATGGSALAMHNIVEKAGAEVVGYVFLIELLGLEGRKKLTNVESVVKYGVAKDMRILFDATGLVDVDQERYDGEIKADVLEVNDESVTVVWKLEDKVDNMDVPFNKIKKVFIDGEAYPFKE